MESPEEGSVSMAPQQFRELELLESRLLEGEAQVQAPEQSPGAPAGDNQMVKPLVIGGPVEDGVSLAEVVHHPDTCEEGDEAAIGELKVTEVVDVKNEGEEVKEHKQEGEQDQQPELEKDPEQACDSKDQHAIQRLPQSSGGPTEGRSKIEELELLQLELSFVNARCSGALARIKARVAKARGPYFQRRKTIIQGIPGFWAKAIMNHPQMSSIISSQDEDLLGYMLSLEVEYNPGLRMYRMMFSFSENPYFRNDIVTKDYELSIIGYKESDSSTIEWIGQAEHGYANCMQDTTRLTFFNWFCAHKFPGSNRIAEIIMDDLWPNPLYYYPKEDHS
ncbi:testis-specific Y-encoded protein 1-like [Arvicanthis niloticus]|uniref:testis-specific Y-encoded protein 1-like n=1 Tax=Arvicanthis niloticus TaxID=61156 RepID=UPI0014864830|nr:testis-specific Y-encoded protein 1-like [Arvicanthis niloticus]